MTIHLADLDAADIALALLRHHLLQPPAGASPKLHSARSGADWGLVLVTANETDPDAPLVIVHGSQGQLLRSLLDQALVRDQRYLFIVPSSLRPLLRSVLSETEYGRQCLLYSCRRLLLDRQASDLVRVTGPSATYAYRRLVDGRTASEARVNWQVEHFAELGVYTKKEYRGRGFAKDVVYAAAREVLASGRCPLYVVSRHNRASIAVCEALGFHYTGISEYETVGRFSPAGHDHPQRMKPGRDLR